MPEFSPYFPTLTPYINTHFNVQLVGSISAQGTVNRLTAKIHFMADAQRSTETILKINCNAQNTIF
jgi:hypothetical protein